jgi:hypothetical protein
MFTKEMKILSKKVSRKVEINPVKFDIQSLKINSYNKPSMYRSDSIVNNAKKDLNLNLGAITNSLPNSKSRGKVYLYNFDRQTKTCTHFRRCHQRILYFEK